MEVTFATSVRLKRINCRLCDSALYDTIVKLRIDNLQNAFTEYLHYKECQPNAPTNPYDDTRKIVYEFVEKVILLKLLKQPGHLKFITRLHIDMFDVSVSNDMRKYIFCLPEGHCPN